MSANVISHPRAHRKRGSTWGWTARRVGALIITSIGIVAASWLAPEPNSSAPALPAPGPQAAQPVLPPAPPEPVTVDLAADLVGGSAARTQRAASRRAGVPPNENADPQPDGYEILSAAELASISQARE